MLSHVVQADPNTPEKHPISCPIPSSVPGNLRGPTAPRTLSWSATEDGPCPKVLHPSKVTGAPSSTSSSAEPGGNQAEVTRGVEHVVGGDRGQGSGSKKGCQGWSWSSGMGYSSGFSGGTTLEHWYSRISAFFLGCRFTPGLDPPGLYEADPHRGHLHSWCPALGP